MDGCDGLKPPHPCPPSWPSSQRRAGTGARRHTPSAEARVFWAFPATHAGNPRPIRRSGQEADYQLKVIVPDMDAFQELLLNRITRIPGVTGVHSSFVLRRVVDRTDVPV